MIAIGKRQSTREGQSMQTVSLSHILCDLLDFNKTKKSNERFSTTLKPESHANGAPNTELDGKFGGMR